MSYSTPTVPAYGVDYSTSSTTSVAIDYTLGIQAVVEQLAAMVAELVAMNTKLQDHTDRFDTVIGKLQDHTDQFIEINTELDAHTQQFTDINTELDNHTVQLTKLASPVIEIPSGYSCTGDLPSNFWYRGAGASCFDIFSPTGADSGNLTRALIMDNLKATNKLSDINDEMHSPTVLPYD